MKKLWFHGTNEQGYKGILESNHFKAGTYFTPYFDTAISMGGEYVFAVVLDIDSDYWEWISPTDMFVANYLHSIRKVQIELIHYDSDKQNYLVRDDDKDYCTFCNGHGELNYPNDGHHLLPGGAGFGGRTWEIEVCQVCHGYGTIPQKVEV